MSWYREASQVWKRRLSLTINNTGGGAGTIDAEGSIPVTLDDFWGAIDSSGIEMRVTAADGTTLLAYSIASFSKTNRTCTLSIDGMTSYGDGVHQAFLYYDSAGSPTGAVATTITSAKTIYIESCGPGPNIVRALPFRPGDTQPARKFQKAASEVIKLAFDLAPRLKRSARPYQGYPYCEEMQWADYTVSEAGAADAALKTAANSRFYAGRWLIVEVKAGTTGDNYTVVATVRTVDGGTNSYSVFAPTAWVVLTTQAET